MKQKGLIKGTPDAAAISTNNYLPYSCTGLITLREGRFPRNLPPACAGSPAAGWPPAEAGYRI